MSANLLRTITDRIIAQLKNIDGTGDYNNNIENRAYKGFKTFDQTIEIPSIFLGFAMEGESGQTDQVHYNVPIEIEIYGYVRDSDSAFDEALKLASDIDVAIYADEGLNDNVWGLTLQHSISSEGEYGVVNTLLTAVAEYIV